MIGFLLVFMIFVSVVYSALSGSISDVSNAVISGGGEAVRLILSLAGTMAVWGGIMRVAERSGLTDSLAKILKPPLRLIFRGLKKNSAALSAIAMNFTANLLGLGNAATPLGIEAMQLLEKEEKPGGRASPNMVKLAVMNACSVELIPATVAALRAEAGSAAPLDILPCVLVTSLCSLTAALLVAEVLERGESRD